METFYCMKDSCSEKKRFLELKTVLLRNQNGSSIASLQKSPLGTIIFKSVCENVCTPSKHPSFDYPLRWNIDDKANK